MKWIKSCCIPGTNFSVYLNGKPRKRVLSLRGLRHSHTGTLYQSFQMSRKLEVSIEIMMRDVLWDANLEGN